MGLNSKYSMGKWEITAKEQGGDQWMENYWENVMANGGAGVGGVLTKLS